MYLKIKKELKKNKYKKYFCNLKLGKFEQKNTTLILLKEKQLLLNIERKFCSGKRIYVQKRSPLP